MKHATLTTDGTSSVTSYSEEDGRSFVGQHMDLDPHIKRVSMMRDIRDAATKASNPNGWELEARIPIPVVTAWCSRNGYTFDQWARNEDRAKDKFLAYFKQSRDFTKLINTNLQNKRKSSQVPVSLSRNAMDLTGIGQ